MTETATSVEKAMRLLDVFRQHGPVVGVTEMARLARLSKSTTFRLMTQLERAGYLESSRGCYSLSLRNIELAGATLVDEPAGLRATAGPFLSELFLHVRSVVQLGVLDATEVVCLDRVCAPNQVVPAPRIGARTRASYSALGKAMLAFGTAAEVQQLLAEGLDRRTPRSIVLPGLFVKELQRIRSVGIAIDREEASLGITSVAAPVLVGGRAVAAVSASHITGRFDLGHAGTHVARAARSIAAALHDNVALVESR